MSPEREIADVTARARISEHEAVCAERWGQIKASVHGLWWVVLVSAGALICGQAGLIITLAIKARP